MKLKMDTKETNGLSGSKIIVIGGSSGIGFAVAKAVSEIGAEVIIASGNKERVSAAVDSLKGKVKGFAVDVSDENQVKNFFEALGSFDHLVYTAGENIRFNLINDTDLEGSKEYFTIRYWGAFLCTKYATPFIKKSIIYTSGIASQRSGAGWSLGASICGAMESFTKAVALEIAPIRANIVSPGVVKTNLWNGLSEEDKEALYDSYTQKLPVKMVAEADDIAKTYLYLMQQEYSTGQVVVVDGGALLV